MTMTVEERPIESVKPYANNPRINDNAVDAVAASIKEFGFRIPIVVDADNTIICGHTRLKAAQRLNLNKVPVHVAHDLSPDQVRALRIADNQTAQLSSWDFDLLPIELSALQDADFDISLIGFSEEELAKLLGNDEPLAGQTDPDAVPGTPEEPVSKTGETYTLGKHRLMVGSATEPADMHKLMGEDKADLLLTDPPYNVNYTGATQDALTIQNDSMDDASFRAFLTSAFGVADSFMKPGAAFYIWHADSEGFNFRAAARDIQWAVRQCLIWNKNSLVMGRQDYHWKHEPCQPAGTMVLTPGGERPIEGLQDGDRVVSFDKYAGAVKGMREGYPVRKASRRHVGCLYGVGAGGKRTWATSEHRFTVKFAKTSHDLWCVYLMRKGDWWRIGITRMYNTRGFGLKVRLKDELADAAWVLSVHRTRNDAIIQESMLSAKYGIPQTVWATEKGVTSRGLVRSVEDIRRIYSCLDLGWLRRSARACLEFYGRRLDLPLLVREQCALMCSRRCTMQVSASNLIPEIMMVPLPGRGQANKNFSWQPIESVLTKHHDGPVYSLEVEQYGHYIADGIVVHNCLYGWKAGAAHQWCGDRKQTTVLDFNRPSRNSEHPTMKPVELFCYQMKNSTRRGQMVLDPFAGSGTSVIAAEQLGRQARVMELDPRYADVVRRRWAEFVHGEDCDWEGFTPALTAEPLASLN